MALAGRWRPAPIHIGGRAFDFARAYVVGVVNVTPDSFSDGGELSGSHEAIERGRDLAAAGADIIDIGGESTRPGAAAVSVADEIARVLPVIDGLADLGVPLSIDTTKAAVAEAAMAGGASVINDVSGGLFDPQIIEVVAETGAIYVLGHVRGDRIEDVHAAESAPPSAREVESELGVRLDTLPKRVRARTIVDPGLGFGKPAALNLELTRNSGRLAAALQCAVMIGSSRKRYLAELPGLEGRPAPERDDETIGASLAAVACGAHFVRVHAVDKVRRALVAFEASAGLVGGLDG